jgi:ABC-2 type transport system ATP-binding protein
VLDGIDLAVHAGELVALLGPNGAGKTTTVEILEGYRTGDGGSVRVLGEDPRHGGPALRARVGFMLQGGGGLPPRAAAGEALRLFATLHDGGRDPTEVLRQTGLEDVAGIPIRRLSGGERQRLALAIALVGDPEVLLLDEPTAGLDPAARRATREMIAGLRDAGRGILLTTHDLADAEGLADRVVVLHDGRIVADGPPRELMAGAVTAGIRATLHARPAPGAVDRLRAAVGRLGDAVVHVPENVDPVELRVSAGAQAADAIAEIAAWAAREGLLILELRTGAASLEERYLELTGDTAVEDST